MNVFAAYPTGGGPATVVHLRLDAAGGYDCGPLAHYVRHSPDGFAWGYSGSGPTELARCLLIASLGEEARCRTCDGKGNTDQAARSCVACDLGFDRDRVERRYFRVRDRLVARMPDDEPLALTGADVIAAADLTGVFGSEG